jgi:hypothetical protein
MLLYVPFSIHRALAENIDSALLSLLTMSNFVNLSVGSVPDEVKTTDGICKLIFLPTI